MSSSLRVSFALAFLISCCFLASTNASSPSAPTPAPAGDNLPSPAPYFDNSFNFTGPVSPNQNVSAPSDSSYYQYLKVPNVEGHLYQNDLSFNESTAYTINATVQSVYNSSDLFVWIRRSRPIPRFTHRILVRVSTSPNATDLSRVLGESFVEMGPNDSDSVNRRISRNIPTGIVFIHIARAAEPQDEPFSLRLSAFLAIPLKEVNRTGNDVYIYNFKFSDVQITSALAPYHYDRWIFYAPTLYDMYIKSQSYNMGTLRAFVPLKSTLPSLDYATFGYDDWFFAESSTLSSSYKCKRSAYYQSYMLSIIVSNFGNQYFRESWPTQTASYSASVKSDDGSDACDYCNGRNN